MHGVCSRRSSIRSCLLHSSDDGDHDGDDEEEDDDDGDEMLVITVGVAGLVSLITSSYLCIVVLRRCPL